MQYKDGAIIIRTSDRGLFRRCRRKWAWNSAVQGNWEPRQHALPLWLGSGFHFALEDFHGYRRFDRAADAFSAYAEATIRLSKVNRIILPDEAEENIQVATGMLDYYQYHWFENRPAIETLYIDGVPQVEVDFEIELPIKGPNGERVLYRGTFDRVGIDSTGAIYIVEYKTAKQFSTSHFDVDAQITAYCWACNVVYDRPCTGVIYQQHVKNVPQPPRFLKTKGKFSVDKRQHTTAALYRKSLKELYGEVNNAPAANVDFYNDLLLGETEYGDKFIRRDFVTRSERQIEAEGEKILMEAGEMVNPNLPLYPSPTRDCSFTCQFLTACISLDDGSDFEQELREVAQQRERTEVSWRRLVDQIRERAEREANNLTVMRDINE